MNSTPPPETMKVLKPLARRYESIATVEEIKRYTGLGTGPCQGKECVALLCRILIDRGALDPATAQPFTARPPLEPVTFATLAAASQDAAADPAEAAG